MSGLFLGEEASVARAAGKVSARGAFLDSAFDRVGEIAEKEGHHPDIYLTWGRVRLNIWTHKIDGLSRSDFVLAAKCDQEP